VGRHCSSHVDGASGAVGRLRGEAPGVGGPLKYGVEYQDIAGCIDEGSIDTGGVLLTGGETLGHGGSGSRPQND
jgi:hypothetical protein